MIDKILQVTHSYEVIRPLSPNSLIPWQSVLRFALDKNVQALIDTGALLAGVTNCDAADYLLKHPSFDLGGVTYYDSEEHNCWMIAEKTRRIKVPLKKASMLEKETFVIFDEARSRGSDMKLLPNAAAVLTLGPKLTKDKLMQGAGRMRQLGCNQTLWIASFDEVAQSVLQTSEHSEESALTTLDVLNWVMDNTKTESVRGLLEWAGNGIHFRKTQLNRDEELVDENWTLETYRDKLHVDKIAQVIQSKMHFQFEDSADDLIAQICSRGFVYGLDDEVCVTSHTDECERELQVEEEIQQEQEVQVIKCAPTNEKIWKYNKILHAHSVDDLEGTVEVFNMTWFIRKWISPKEMTDMKWSSTKIFGTENFFSTIKARVGMDRMNEFLRVIDVVLVFKNGDVLLVSECEADHILELLWSTRGNSPACSFSFVNLAFACESLNRVGAFTKFNDAYLALGSCIDHDLAVLSIIACQVYNGETVVAKNQESVVVPAFRELLLPLVQRAATLSNFVKSRGNSHKWTRSFLHELCCRMDLEDCKTFTSSVAELDLVKVLTHSCGHFLTSLSTRLRYLREVCRRLETSGDDVHKRRDVGLIDGSRHTVARFTCQGECGGGEAGSNICTWMGTNATFSGYRTTGVSFGREIGSAFDRKLWKAQQDKGFQRSALFNETSKTPQVIAVVAAIAHNLCCGQGLYRKTILTVQVSLLQMEVEGISCRDVDAHDHTVELLEPGNDVSSLRDQCASVRAKIDDFVDVLNRQSAIRYRSCSLEALIELETQTWLRNRTSVSSYYDM
ncbi:LOW QUALITY PROTEIN: Hypothetical protein PHPALM_7182 [Phytophthora palmivora]|uniref:ubiquitinyl hydrolase 1 n=1 Tax=Phytophthora palmivora TaxID=4796 RepID=A0A2P4YCZ4_9STRA|nr:LOW QUALITY PROTEIN: Hypothetical protein PHPALM_7182 [Phytophthora palmivora]